MENHQDKYCLLYHWRDVGECGHLLCNPEDENQITSYCFRPVDNDNFTVTFDFQYSSHPNFTFADLREKNITSQMLLSWSSSINIAEQYQIYLNNYHHLNSSTDDEIVFYNCTSSWFGPFCRFQLDYQKCEYLNDEDQKIESFSDIVTCIFTWKDPVYDTVEVTCYIHLTCQSLLTCLDWREICDRKRDCLDGTDEKDCWQLELNYCSDDEYRCSNGQCVPIEYIRYNLLSPECMDRTDQSISSVKNRGCFQDPDFQCEERACRPGENEFPCGDGQCISELDECKNGRHRLLTDKFCPSITLRSIELYEYINDHACILFCSKANCVKSNYSTLYKFRHLPLLLGHVRVMIPNKKIDSSEISSPNYICYDDKLCPQFPSPTALFQNLTCHQFNDLGLQPAGLYSKQQNLVNDIKHLFRGCLIIINETFYCNYSTMYQCKNSTKCISKYRLMDGIGDCPYNDDETYNQSCFLNDIRQRFKCRNERDEKCFSSLAMLNGKKECIYGEDEYEYEKFLQTTRISFLRICDGGRELLPLFIDGQNETDETGCEPWECNNTYSRCDGFWLCKNGADEINCLPSTCLEHHHDCIFLNDTLKMSCLPIAQTGDGMDDCLGGTDERTTYRKDYINDMNSFYQYYFHCLNDTKLISHFELCNSVTDCHLNDDETFCRNWSLPQTGICFHSEAFHTDIGKFLCGLNSHHSRDLLIYFKLHNVLVYPSRLVENKTFSTPSTQTTALLSAKDQDDNVPVDLDWECNRGILIYLQMSKNISTSSCLCSPSYYGDKCQYQNQRVSLTVRVRVASEWRSILVFLITLIDTERYIESHNYFEFQSVRDCRAKFDIYLLYATRPKNSSKSYSVQIDAFNELTLKYRASWIFPLRFSFLPVHRLSVVLDVPCSNAIFLQPNCSPTCIHGQCFQYVNNRNSTFCHCERGWSGIRCDVKYRCDCALNSLCINNNICLCPPGRFGVRCYLYRSSCDSTLCLNGGRCTPIDGRYVSSKTIRSRCTCSEGYVGEYCEHQLKQTRIDISFHQKLIIPSSILIHFIAVRNYSYTEPNRTSIAKKLEFNQYLLTMYTSTTFNIAIAQMLRQYYLVILREQNITLANISTEIIPSRRCQSLDEIFNNTFMKQHLLKRIKYYHVPCKQHQKLICFYDDVYFCLCTLDRSANCFEFDHNMTYHCEKYKYCGNDGYCLQDDLTCPSSSFCTCDRCYFGSRCQFSTKRSTLSLNIILAYHFRSKTTIDQQPIIVKITIVLTSLIFVIGIINSLFSFQAFRGKEAQSVGCGLYLFASSFVSVITVIILVLKCSFLIASEIGWITSHIFLQIQCISMDFLLRFLLSANDWLTVCVAIERTINVSQGVNFNKRKSKKMAKLMITVVFFGTFSSYIYDPVYRRVIDDEEAHRTWCLNEYSSFVQIFDRFLNIFHFSVPFIINGISAMMIIIVAARIRSRCQKKIIFKEHLREQLRYHKHLLISPLILVVLALPRLVLSFIQGCMGSPRESWFYLIGYFIAFIPSIMTFVVFALPSDVYMKQFTQSMKQLCHR